MPADVLPGWFAQDCSGSLGSGLQLVEVQRHAEDSGTPGRILIDADGRIWIPADAYQQWTGRQPPASPPRQTDDGEWHPLDAIPHHTDACQARLQIASQLPTQHHSGQHGSSTALPASTGALLNLDLFGHTSPGQGARLHALTELGLSTGIGYWRSRHLLQPEGNRRLDSQLRYDIISRGETVVLGDQLTSNGLTDNILFAGLSWGSDFSQRPELPRYPIPVLAGDAVLSSVAELYVDDQLRQREHLGPGPYQLQPLLTPQGFGEIQVITRDSLGRETRISQPFYSSSSLLAAGLDDYRINAGRLRLGFGSAQDRYGEHFASGDWRRGLNDRLTAGLHADVMPDRQGLQGSLLYGSPDTGLSGLASGMSHDRQAGTGYLLGISQEWLSRHASLQGSWRHASPAFVELGREPGAIATRASLQASLRPYPGLQTSAGWLREDRRDRDDLAIYNLALQFQLQTGSQWIISASNVPGNGWTRSLALFQTLAGKQSLAAQLQLDPDGNLSSLLQWSWQPDDHPWSLRADRADSRRDGHDSSSRVSAIYNGSYGLGSLGVVDSTAGRSLQGNLSTSLSWVPGSLFWGRRLSDSFVVVDTGEPGITLYRNHQVVGRTDAHGRMLISDLEPYHPALLALAADEIPMASQPARMEQDIRPPRGAGRVDWRPPAGSRMSAWQARLDDGGLLPAGSSIQHADKLAELPSGHDGLLYLPADWTGSRLDITLKDGRRCRIEHLPASDLTAEATCQLQP